MKITKKVIVEVYSEAVLNCERWRGAHVVITNYGLEARPDYKTMGLGGCV